MNNRYADKHIQPQADLAVAFKDTSSAMYGICKTEGKQAFDRLTNNAYGNSSCRHKDASDASRKSNAALLSSQKSILEHAWATASNRDWSIAGAAEWLRDTSRKVMGYLQHNFTSYKVLGNHLESYGILAANFAHSPMALGHSFSGLKSEMRFDSIVNKLEHEKNEIPAQAYMIKPPAPMAA